MVVTAHCRNVSCGHKQELDLLRLRDTLGADTPAMRDDLLPRMKCGECQSRNVDLIYTPDYAKADAKRTGNAYAKTRDGRCLRFLPTSSLSTD
ncbi:hypothetical protein ASD99_29515 [Mesorhizobium sp. Root695]|uniref:hypothetical protein n=1 Tax=Mesorhizobium sp. Root695 TaxID=1736589 RepID=UPI00070CFC64|nr:hypothetical protein [Mesorhizobium sp. Root695]KRB23826.1 hypothetical protein ASD99_29515 [Mesorhizobium sp. Root695]